MYFWVWYDKLCTSAFGNYLPFFTSQALSGWMGADTHFRFLQKYLIWFKLRLGHSRTFTELSTSHSCCVLRVIVLLEGEPSAQSEVLNALDWVFIKAVSIFWCIELFFYSDVSLSPCCWKTAPQHEAATSTLYFWDATLQVMSSACFPSNMVLRIEVHQTRESCFSQSEDPLGVFLQILSVFSCVFTEERIEFGHTALKAQIGGVLQWCLSFCRFVPSAHMINLTISFLVTSLTKALLHQLFSLARRPSLGRVLVSNFFHKG